MSCDICINYSIDKQFVPYGDRQVIEETCDCDILSGNIKIEATLEDLLRAEEKFHHSGDFCPFEESEE